MKNNKFKKILLAFTCLFTMFFSNVSDISANAYPSPSDWDKEKYPYYIIQYHVWSQDRGDGTIVKHDYLEYFVSNEPFVVDIKDGYGEKPRNKMIRYYTMNSSVGEKYFPFSTDLNASYLNHDYIVYSSHDVTDINGNIVFQKPLDPEKPVTPDTSWTQKLVNVFLMILGAIVGGMILLTVFFRLLKRLPSFFRTFGIH